uniref:Putative secreted protein ovary overexpressed n=1 Tax=Rhipicephalus microplus TaxID=6941 RepID=A0A6M2DAW1_RHIMP
MHASKLSRLVFTIVCICQGVSINLPLTNCCVILTPQMNAATSRFARHFFIFCDKLSNYSRRTKNVFETLPLEKVLVHRSYRFYNSSVCREVLKQFHSHFTEHYFN